MTRTWHFFAVRAATTFGFVWQWQKQKGNVIVTSSPFDFYFDCISDARVNGYTGRLPAATKAPLERSPSLRPATKHISPAVSAAEPPNDTMRVISVSPTSRQKRRDSDLRGADEASHEPS